MDTLHTRPRTPRETARYWAIRIALGVVVLGFLLAATAIWLEDGRLGGIAGLCFPAALIAFLTWVPWEDT